MPAQVPGVQGKKETAKIASFISHVVSKASAKGVVVGLSGGIDSSVVGALCVRAIGKDRVLGLALPSDHTPEEDNLDAKELARVWGIRLETVPITPMARALVDATELAGTKIARANVEARARMAVAYYYANTLGYLVAGTGDRSEEILGFFTKGGDGQADFLPIAHLFKTQVRQLGRYLGLTESMVKKPASPQLWPGHRASDELPADYDRLDVVLHGIFDLKLKPRVAANKAGVPLEVVNRAMEMNRKTEHKRTLAPSLA